MASDSDMRVVVVLGLVDALPLPVWLPGTATGRDEAGDGTAVWKSWMDSVSGVAREEVELLKAGKPSSSVYRPATSVSET